DGFTARQVEAPGAGIEGGEQAILHEHAGVGEAVEQCRLAGVRVADQRDGGDAGADARFSLRAPRLRQITELALQLGDSPEQTTQIDLELRLTRTAGPDAAGLLAEGPASAAQAGKAVTEQGQLDLGASLLGAGVLSEDVEDHGRAVDGGAPEQLLEVAALGRAELVVEHDGVGVDLEGDLAQLFGFALADIGGGVGTVAPLENALGDVGAGGVDEERQL